MPALWHVNTLVTEKNFVPEVYKDDDKNQKQSTKTDAESNADFGSSRAFLYSNCT